MGRGDTFKLSHELSNSTSGMMLQRVGKPSAQEEDDSIKVLSGEWRNEKWGGDGGGESCSCLLCCAAV